ncbi:bifunctional aldehyde dehydrogenase/enoyl-CoA hydratase [Brevibacterium ravenspurgense]|uniref:Bifunctional aldehyde dehydrogenase/enoyl-CoA hydratase n=1 Tax=Brevibacterium ravenspurgense TaxID=479117 RepID=A0A150H8Y9_9MICO|nr:MaoC family dehydratase [Brevibacterium ravenspurgense]KXZ58562.1 bifunctional aldehyde dehydrogenase/enoyl-CoA hydratase [Brevibacterium ravenspurgense]
MTDTSKAPVLTELEVGQEVLSRTIPISRADLVRYAGASGDYNTIHWNERFAKEVGLPNVIAHGMLTMALAVGPITQWAGSPCAVIDYRTRFTKPVVVPDAENGSPEQPTVELAVTATVGAVDEDNGTVRLDVNVTAEDTSVLGRTQVKVRLA